MVQWPSISRPCQSISWLACSTAAFVVLHHHMLCRPCSMLSRGRAALISKHACVGHACVQGAIHGHASDASCLRYRSDASAIGFCMHAKPQRLGVSAAAAAAAWRGGRCRHCCRCRRVRMGPVHCIHSPLIHTQSSLVTLRHLHGWQHCCCDYGDVLVLVLFPVVETNTFWSMHTCSLILVTDQTHAWIPSSMRQHTHVNAHLPMRIACCARIIPCGCHSWRHGK